MAEGPGRLTFLDNHDMNRFLFVAGGRVDRLKLAALCQFTLAPTPVIYYGTEVGLSQALDKEAVGFGGDAEVRADMPWDEASWHRDLGRFYRCLIELRRSRPVLCHNERRTVHLDDARATYAYLLSAADEIGRGNVLVAFILGDEAAEIPLPSRPTGWRLDVATQEGVRC